MSSVRLAIIDYGSGNLRSAAKALERVAPPGAFVHVTEQPADIAAATHIVLPGVGAFADCMQGLQRVEGMIHALTHAVQERNVPFLGICVGMQMLFTQGEEHGLHAGLGWLEGNIVKIPAATPQGAALKIPHMGWNALTLHAPEHPLLAGIAPEAHAYFVHSYYAVPKDATVVQASASYGINLPAVVAQGNIIGTQFHPEKSQATGLKLLENFLTL